MRTTQSLPTGVKLLHSTPPSAQFLANIRQSGFSTAQFYWGQKLKRPWISTPIEAANVAAGFGLHSQPYALGLKGASFEELRRAPDTLSRQELVRFTNYDIDFGLQSMITTDPLLTRFSREPFHLADADSLPVEGSSLDLILMTNPNWQEMMNLQGEAKPLLVLKEYERVLKPGGILWLTFLREADLAETKSFLTDIPYKFSVLIGERNPFPSNETSIILPARRTERAAYDSHVLIAERL